MTDALSHKDETATLVPGYARHRLARAGAQFRQDGTLEDAVILLADLSGYSRICATMVDRHARSDPRRHPGLAG